MSQNRFFQILFSFHLLNFTEYFSLDNFIFLIGENFFWFYVREKCCNPTEKMVCFRVLMVIGPILVIGLWPLGFFASSILLLGSALPYGPLEHSIYVKHESLSRTVQSA